jgi:hypothetical protein
MTQRVLVIGGTGMLAGAVRHIARRGASVTLIARAPQALAREVGAHALPMDWADRASVTEALATLRSAERPDLMITWVHERGLWCLPAFEELLPAGARSIRVYGSAAGDPRNGIKTDPAPPQHVIRQDIVLGWVNEAQGRRWLTEEEISGGVIAAYEDPAQRARIVGELTSGA